MKIGQLYDLDSFRRLVPKVAQGREAELENIIKTRRFGDASPGIVLAVNLRWLDPRIFEVKYPELTFVNSGIEINNSGGYANVIERMKRDIQGGFVDAKDNSKDKGKITLTGEEAFLRVKERQAFSTWTDTEIEQAKLQNINLPQDHVVAHNRVYLQELDLAGYVGISGNEGLLNYSGFVTTNVSTLPVTGADWYDFVAGCITAQHSAVMNIPEYMADRVDMPISIYNLLQRTNMVVEAFRTNVLAALRKDYPNIKFSATVRAENVEGARVLSVYSVNPQAMVFRMPQPLKVGDIVQPGSFEFKFDSKYRMAGLDVLEDASGMLWRLPLA
jgi:hypothetical protein